MSNIATTHSNSNSSNSNSIESELILKRILSNEEELENTMRFIWDDIVDEVILGLSFDVHRDVKLGILFLDETDEESEKKYEIVDEIGLDVFGQEPMKKQFECVCPNCQRNMAASRFAPHLEKCMGMGRNSSRIANRRIANSGKDAGSDDDENDDDWTYNSDKKATKKKRDKSCNSPRRSKSSKLKNGDIPSVSSNMSDSGSSFTNYENMSTEERKLLLMQMCGVISEHTKKMCTRSHRCPQHTDEQRKAVRLYLLGQQGALMDTSGDVPVDIDTFDESEGHAFQESLSRLWDPGNSSNTSPADSTSTNNSTSSTRKRDKASNKKSRPGNSKKSGKNKSAQQPAQQQQQAQSLSANSSHSSTGSFNIEPI